MVNLIQPTEIKAAIITGLKRLRLRDAPLHEWIPLALAAPRFIGGDADIMQRAQLTFEPIDLLGDEVGFELPGTPADTDTRPTVAVLLYLFISCSCPEYSVAGHGLFLTAEY